MTINNFDLQFKNEIYSCIFELMQFYFSSDITSHSLPNQTRYDNLANCFYQAFLNNKGQVELAATKFEGEAVRLNLI